jgi:hypothetical protein
LSKQGDQLKKAHPKHKVETFEVYAIDGELFAPKKFFAQYYGITSMTLTKWEEKKDGFEKSQFSLPKLHIHSIKETFKYREKAVQPSNAQRATKNKDLALESKEYEELELEKKRNEVILQNIKIDEQRANLVPSDTTDKAIAEFGAYFVGFLRNSRITLSRDLENMTKDEIFDFLDVHYGEFVNDVAKRVNFEQSDDLPTVYDEMFKRISGNE